MHVIVVVFVSCFVKITLQAKPTAQRAAGIMPGAKPASHGRVTIKIPIKPTNIEITLTFVNFSPNKNGEANITQSGTENSNAKSCANGISVNA